jgi:DNA-binding LacI/PurR family transcriptional regulator
MPRTRCPRCNKTERILKSGMIRGKQRFYCKDCNYHFTLVHNTRKSKLDLNSHNRPTSLKDIAKAAGVSITTVSRALNNHPDISEETRHAIRQLADGMNYQPNIIAQSLVNRSTNTLGVIIPNLETTFFSSMLSGIQHVAAQSGYRVVICQSDESHLSEISNLQALMNNMIDGLLICHTLDTSKFDHIRMQLNRNIPIVQFYRVSEELKISKILADDENGAFEVTEHLVRAGCKRIAILLGPKYLPITVKRETGYRKVLRKWKIKFDPKLVKYVNFSNDSVVDAVDSWLSMKEGIDAIFSISDKSAVQIIRHLKSKGIKIPQTISVAGFGNEYTGEIVEPKLTTFDVKTKEIGEAAARTLLEQIISKEKDPKNLLVRGEFIQRESTRKQKRRG